MTTALPSLPPTVRPQAAIPWLPALIFLALNLSLPAEAAEPVAVDLRCLSSGGSKPIRLEWKSFAEASSGWRAAYVKYRGSKTVIPLVLRSSEATDMPEGRPWEFTTVWQEVVDGRISGEYQITSQGARIYDFVYTNLRNGKTVAFTQDDAAWQPDGCRWQ